MNYRAICLTVSAALLCSQAQAMDICGELKQGEFIVGKDLSAHEVIFDDIKYPVTEDGLFILAFARETPKKSKLYYTDGSGNKHSVDLIIEQTTWDVQRIDGVPQQKVTPDTTHDAEIQRERKDVGVALKTMEPGDYWRQGFILPLTGRISGTFGNYRIFNGVPRSPHTGVDIAAPEGTPIKAAGAGKVILAGGNYFYSGNMVIIDHGQGLQTIYAHLKNTHVKAGDVIKQGDIIGTVGKTGRATGPHLHWGASINNIRFRPHALLETKCLGGFDD